MMKHKAYSMPVKTVAFILTVLLAVSCLLSLFGAAFLAEDGYYADPARDYTQSGLFRYYESAYGRFAFQYFFFTEIQPDTDASLEYYERRLDPAETNYRYSIFDEQKQYLFGNANVVSYAEAIKRGVENGNRYGANGKMYLVVGMLDPAMSIKDEFYHQQRFFDAVIGARYLILVYAGVSLLLAVGLLVYLLCAAGRRSDDPTPACRGVDRMPSDVYLAVGFGAIVLLALGAERLFSDLSFGEAMYVSLLLTILLILLCAAILLGMILSVGTRIKTRTLFSNTLIFRVLRLLWRFVTWICRGIRAFFANLPILWKSALACGGFLLALLLLLLGARQSAFAALLLVALIASAFAFVMAITLQAKRLQSDASALASGDLAHAISTERYFGELKTHAVSLASIRAGVSRAVFEQVKSDRMRTDLITNVSHDIKTPLTSIVNYVDLLKKEDLPAPASGYVDALERASLRLKKLTLDVIEASKATSGVLPVSLAPADLNEIVRQGAAEYGERFRSANLTLVSALPDDAPIVLCDGRLLWRALDNLLSNAERYALSGTRVYLDVSAEEGSACITIKNVSKTQLNVSPEELTERFVRGDAARSDGGSGLGLSIAKSLLELQNGALALSIDGDLFKAVVRIPLLAAK